MLKIFSKAHGKNHHNNACQDVRGPLRTTCATVDSVTIETDVIGKYERCNQMAYSRHATNSMKNKTNTNEKGCSADVTILGISSVSRGATRKSQKVLAETKKNYSRASLVSSKTVPCPPINPEVSAELTAGMYAFSLLLPNRP